MSITMTVSIKRRASEFASLYEEHGPIEAVFTAIRFLGRSVLPEPYATRFRYRCELIQTAMFPDWQPILPVTTRLWIALHGYEERQYLPYEFDRGTDPGEYLSDLQRKCARAINDDPGILSNKNRFHEYLLENGFARYRPRRYGTVEDGRFRSVSRDGIATLLHREAKIVIKEELGGGGNRVLLCEHHPEGVLINGELCDVELEEVIATLDDAIVTEYCSQASYLDELYPGSPNTLRILTMRADDGSVYIPAAVQRIGAAEAGALDNFSQGGLSALVDLESGTLSAAAQIDDDLRVRWHERHPDTGARIEGRRVPGWGSIRERVRAIAEQLPELRYVGWDILVTEPGEFVIVEGNHFPNPRMIQLHRPLLVDGRVREFFDGTAVSVRE